MTVIVAPSRLPGFRESVQWTHLQFTFATRHRIRESMRPEQQISLKMQRIDIVIQRQVLERSILTVGQSDGAIGGPMSDVILDK